MSNTRTRLPTEEEKFRQDLEQLARVIRQRREAEGITQQQLAARVGISVQHLRRLESPKGVRSEPSAFVVARIAKVLDKPLDDFLRHVRTMEEIVDELLEEITNSGVLKRLGFAAAGYSGGTFEEKRDFFNVVRRAAQARDS